MQIVQKIRSVVVMLILLALAQPAAAVDGTLSPSPYLYALDANGNTVSGACIWTYLAGTSTPATTWTDKGLGTPNTNPIVASSSGIYVAYLQQGISYKFTVETACTAPAHGTTLKTQDNIDAVPGSVGGVDVAGTAGENISAGNVVYLSDGSGGKTQGRWYKGDSNASYSSTLPLIGIAPSAITSGNIGTMRIAGLVTGLAGLTAGARYYVSTGGAMTSTAPVVPMRVGQADSTTSIIVGPFLDAVDPMIFDGRLSLTTGTPVTTADVTGGSAVTLYLVPYTGNKIALYDGSKWNIRAFTQLSTAVPATTNTVYDIFVYDDGTGAVTLSGAVPWTNDTTRATALTLQDGVLAFTGDTTRRYIGSFRTTAVSGQTEDSKGSRYVSNYYNCVQRPLEMFAAAGWNYNTNTIRQANGSTANQVNFLIGWSERPVLADLTVSAKQDATSGTNSFAVGFGLDSTTTFASNQSIGAASLAVLTGGMVHAAYNGFPGVGKHSLSWNEVSYTNTVTAFLANTNNINGLVIGGTIQSGITGSICN